ncbi:hypothetical protein GF402_04025 [Candidatus Fermentibacteria bacterium]|nr:hypothetical protein [Candidatus Fermentibacteria bacterium]
MTARGGYGIAWRVVLVILVLGAIAVGLLHTTDLETELPREEATPPGEVSYTAPDTISVRVLNGAGVNGLAWSVQRFLLSFRDSVVFLAPGDPANADRMSYQETVVASRRKDLSAAMTVAERLWLGKENVVWELPAPGEETEVDVVLYLGEDLGEKHRLLVPYGSHQ